MVAAINTLASTSSASVVEGKRISGRTLITPDIDTQKDMANRRLSHLHASLRVCLDETGHVESVLPVQSSGYANYDARLIGTIRTWVYSPLQVDGEARPFCTMVSFHFKGRLR